MAAAAAAAERMQQFFGLGGTGVGGGTPSRTSESSDRELARNMQEAMQRSNLEHANADFVRREVPVRICKPSTWGTSGVTLGPMVALQHILYAEEQGAFKEAVAQSTSNGTIHPLALIHHSATYNSSLCKLLEYCLSPVLSALWDRQQQNSVQLALLQEEAARLRTQLATKARVTSTKPAPGPLRTSLEDARGRPEATLGGLTSGPQGVGGTPRGMSGQARGTWVPTSPSLGRQGSGSQRVLSQATHEEEDLIRF